MDDDLSPSDPMGASDPSPGSSAPDAFGSFAPPAGLPLYAPPPPPPAPPARRRLSPKVAGLMVGVVALLGATVFAVTALDQPDGASSPEAAVHQLFDAISHRDALGVIESLPANERDVLRQPAIDATQQLERLGILSSFQLNDVPGGQLSVDNLQLTSDDLGPGVVRVNVVGGTISGHSIPSELPIGARLRAIMQKDFGDSSASTKPESFSGELGDSNLQLVTVKDGGGWHVSLGYTIANAIHGDSSTPPDFAAAPAPVGSATPDGAVRDLVDAATSLDARKAVTLMAPDEDAALYAYASLFLPTASSAGRSDDTTVKVSQLGLSVEGSGATRRVHLGTFTVSVADQDQTTQVSFDGRCLTSQLTYKNGAVGIGGTDEIAADGADDAQYDDPSDPNSTPLASDPAYLAELAHDRAAAQKPHKSCAGDDPNKDTGTEGVASLGVLGTATNQLAITVVEVNGRWYVSPVRTLLDTVVISLERLKPSDVDKWGTWFSGFDNPCGTSDSGSSDSSTSQSTTQTTDDTGFGVQTCFGSSDGSSGSAVFTPVPGTVPITPDSGGPTHATLPGADQTMTSPDGTKVGPDGTITEPDGTVIKRTDPGWAAAMAKLSSELGQSTPPSTGG